MKKIFTILVLSMFFIQSCKKVKEEDEVPYKGKNYFPVNVGHQVVYEVEYVTKSAFTGLWDTLQYQVKEITADTYTDSSGQETQKIERYIDNDTTAGFVLYKTWAANLLTSTAHRVEDNIRYVKLIFPQAINAIWDGNSLNTLGVIGCKYTALHVPLTLGSLAFDSTCTVTQINDSTVTLTRYSAEQYATNIGMIYKINSEITYTPNDTIESAAIYTEKVISFIK